MPILQNASDFASGDQLSPGTLNALTESAKFVKNGSGVTNSGNTTDETSCNINAQGEIEVKDLGISTAKLAGDCVTGAKIADDAIDSEHYAATSIDNEHLAAGSVAGSGTGATGTNVIEAASIGFADLNDDVISGQTELSAAPDDADELFISDAGTLKKIGVDNFFKHPAVPKAYGLVTMDTGTPALSEGYNCTLNSDTTTTRVIDLTNAMVDTSYVIVASYGESTGVVTGSLTVTINSASQFTLNGVEDANRTIHFCVYGTLA